jgi:hypothetical protein
VLEVAHSAGRADVGEQEVPVVERFGVPSAPTVAAKPRRCSNTTRFMSSLSCTNVIVACPMSERPVAEEHPTSSTATSVSSSTEGRHPGLKPLAVKRELGQVSAYDAPE